MALQKARMCHHILAFLQKFIVIFKKPKPDNTQSITKPTQYVLVHTP